MSIFLKEILIPESTGGIDSKEDERNTKKLINIIVKECKGRIEGLKQGVDERGDACCLRKNQKCAQKN